MPEKTLPPLVGPGDNPPDPVPVVITEDMLEGVTVAGALEVLDQLIYERKTHAEATHLAESSRARHEVVTLTAVRAFVADKAKAP